MHTDENNAIRYLMKEMDPSEEMEFEKRMREDEDLLIEVESLRATRRKLSDLPQPTPPKNLTKQIVDEAKQIQSDRVNTTNNITFFLKWGIAAAVLLSAFTGGFYFLSDAPDSSDIVHPVNSESKTVEPWVDRNEIIRYSTNTQAISPQQPDVDYTKSYDKLELVSDPNSTISGSNGILLTGSSD